MKRLVFLLCVTATASAIGQVTHHVSLVGNLNTGRYTNDVWGYADDAGNEYAIVGHRTGTAIVLVTPDSLIEVDFVPGVSSTWRDIKTHGNYAYVTADRGNEGLLILDLSPLPDSVRVVDRFANAFTRAHNLYIENGHAYISGSNSARGADILDLANPEVPVEVGSITFNYFHDIFTRNDTLFGSTERRGSLAIFDVTGKARPALVAEIPFPGGGISHNSWATPDGQFVMTTEETSGQSVKMWDISNLGNPTLVDEYLSGSRLAHNTHIQGDYAYISHYADGVRILDISDPSHMVEVGGFDTNAGTSGFAGCWGAYPFTNSGYVYASDQDNGLFVLDFDGTRATRINGHVFDSETGKILSGAQVEVLENGISAISNVDGKYKLGLTAGGIFTLRVSNNGYETANVSVMVGDGETANKLIFLKPSVTTGIADDSGLIPDEFSVAQNYPNPFNGGTTLSYNLPLTVRVKVSIFNTVGSELRVLQDGLQPAGHHQIQWDGRNAQGHELPSGIYYYQIDAAGEVLAGKMIMVK